MFTIAILDVDEFDVSPISDMDTAPNSVNENVPSGTAVGITAFAHDADATTNAITYSLTDNAGGRFAIDSVTGVVAVAPAAVLDREAAASHNITVRATSADGSFSTQSFTINIDDVDEFDVGPITDVNGAPNQVNLNAVAGTPVGITAFAVDNDATNNAITYTLANDAGGRFAIHPITGVITVVGSLTAGTASYDIVVRATSLDGSSALQAFTIAVSLGNPGDFDGDGDLDLADVDALSAAIATGSGNLLYDVNGDGQLTLADLQHWVLNIKRTLMGDSNLDFVVDGQDFIRWNNFKFTATNLWSQGNFNADTVVDGQDFIVWNNNKFMTGPGGLTAGDFDGNGNLDMADVDALNSAIAIGSTNLLYDVNGDGQLSLADLRYWVVDLKQTLMGDSNLDYVVDGQDYIRWNISKFTPTNLWSQGNFNADTVVDGQDYITWNINKFMTGPGGFDAGDFDGNGALDLADVDALSFAIATGSTNLLYDVNSDGQLTSADLQYWVVDLKQALMGDSNLDYVVDGQDYIRWNISKFTSTNLWSQGNFNADTVVDGQDYITWNINKFMTGPGGGAVASLPAATRPEAADFVFAGVRNTGRGPWSPDQDADNYFAQLGGKD